MLPAEIHQAIIEHPSQMPLVIARELTKQFNRSISPSMVIQIKGSTKRSENITAAKEKASYGLDEKMDLMEDTIRTLQMKFQDETLPLKERLEVSKELRQWTKMGMDAVGIHDIAGDQLFVIDAAWQSHAEPE